MKNDELADLCDSCAKTLREVLGKLGQTEDSCSEEEKTILMKGRDALLELICELATTRPGEDSGHKALLRNTLSEIDSSVNYRYSETLIRDIADVCITIRRVANGERREEMKMLKASMLLLYLRNDLRDMGTS
jgi:hypothetical protein